MGTKNGAFAAYVAIILKIVIYGSSSLFTKGLLASTDVLDVIALRFLITAVIFLILNFLGIVRLKLRGKNIKHLLLCAMFEPVLYFVFETVGISMSTTITVGVITALAPISSCIIERAVMKEKTNAFQTAFLALGVAGVLIIVLFTNKVESGGSILGVIMLILSVVSGSLFAAFSRKSSSQFKPMEISCFSAFTGAVCFNSVNITRHFVNGNIFEYFKPFYSAQNLIGFAFLSVISSIFAVWLCNFSLSKIQMSRTAAFSGVSTVYTIALGILINHEQLHIYHIVGTVLIIASVYGVNRFAHKKEKTG